MKWKRIRARHGLQTLVHARPRTPPTPQDSATACSKRSLMPRGVRSAQARARSLQRGQICQRTGAYRAGTLSEALTEHYQRAHPEALGLPAQ